MALLCTAMKKQKKAGGRQHQATRKRGKANHATARKRLRHERALRTLQIGPKDSSTIPSPSNAGGASNLAALDLAGFDARSIRLDGGLGLGSTETQLPGNIEDRVDDSIEDRADDGSGGDPPSDGGEPSTNSDRQALKDSFDIFTCTEEDVQ